METGGLQFAIKMEAVGITVQAWSMIPYDGDELGTTLSLSCGEAATSNDVDVPHPKRIRLLNLNETACEKRNPVKLLAVMNLHGSSTFFSLTFKMLVAQHALNERKLEVQVGTPKTSSVPGLKRILLFTWITVRNPIRSCLIGRC
ncbi:hypothetical protein FCV25MIE_27617 [Fagus crenata]